jgi:hypothetical protein
MIKLLNIYIIINYISFIIFIYYKHNQWRPSIKRTLSLSFSSLRIIILP